MMRATCEMQAGKCEDGKQRYRKLLEQANTGRRMTAEDLDRAATNANVPQFAFATTAAPASKPYISASASVLPRYK